MAFKSVITGVKRTALDAGVNGNGTFMLFQSPKFAAPQDYGAADTTLECVIRYTNNLPNPDVSVAKYNLVAILETEDDEGNWHPFHSQFNPFVQDDYGDTFILKISPTLLILDPGVSFDVWNGSRTIARECLKQGRLPDDFRITVYINEFGYENGVNPGPGSFQEVDLTISFKTYQ